MRRYNELLEKAAQAADLSSEPVPGAPLIELSGQRRVLIENHGGVIQYGANEICVKVRYGHVSVEGSCLELARMTKTQLVIVGCVDCIRLCTGR